MSRGGLKPYYTYEEMELETAGKLSFNIGVRQYFFTIPLLATRGSNPITLSAIYANGNNYAKRYGGKFILGDNCNIDLPPKITGYNSGEKIITLLADGSEEVYKFENDVYKDSITKYTITQEDNEYILTNTDGDKLYYKGLNVFPYEIILANHTKYTITEKENSIEYANTLGCIVEIISSGELVERINYTENGRLFQQIQLFYDQGSVLHIKFYEGNTFTYENKYSFCEEGEKRIIAEDGYSNNSIELDYDWEYFVSKYNLKTKHKLDFIKISLFMYYRIITNLFREETTYYFNQEGLCEYYRDNHGNYGVKTYNDSNELINQSEMSYSMGNLLTNGELKISEGNQGINGFDIGGQFVSIQGTSDVFNPFYNLSNYTGLEIVTPRAAAEATEINKFSISQTLRYEGSIYDSFELSFTIRNHMETLDKTNKVEVYLILVAENEEDNMGVVYSLDIEKVDIEMWHIKTLSIIAEKPFVKIQVVIYAEGQTRFDIGFLHLINLKRSINIDYNENGKVTSVETVSKKEEYTYDGYKLESTMDSEGNYVQNVYDEENRLIRTINPNGTINAYTYNSANNQVVKTTATSYRYEMTSETIYDSTNNFVVKEIDTSNAKTEYQYTNGIVSHILRPNEVKENYSYYSDLNLMNLNIENVTNGFNYENGLMNHINTNNSSRYDIVYEDGQLKKFMFLKDNKSTDYVTFTYLTTNGVITPLIEKKEYANGESYNFDYSQGRMTSITYNYKNVNKPIVEYKYGPGNKLVSETDKQTGRETSYRYDMAGRLDTIESQWTNEEEVFKYYYDAKDNPIFQSKKYLSFTNYSENLPLSRSTSISMEGLMKFYKEQDYFTAFFQNDFNLTNKEEIKAPTKEMSKELLSNYKNIPCLRNTKNYSLAYNFDVLESLNNSQSVGFWFKFANKPTGTVQMLHIGNATYGVGLYYVSTSNKIQLKRGTLKLYESKIQILPNEWNFISLTQENMDEVESVGMHFSICVNGETEEATTGIIGMAPSSIGIGGDLSKGSFIGDITGVIIGGYTKITNSAILEYYRMTKDLLIEAETGAFSAVLNYYTFFEDCRIFPLHQNLKDVEQKIGPQETLTQSPFEFDKDYLFNYNIYAHRYMYKCAGAPLVYHFNSHSSATISMCFVLDEVSVLPGTKRYLFEYDSKGTRIGFYIDSMQILRCDELSGGIHLNKLTSNKLYYFIFSYEYKNNELSYYVYLNNGSIVKGGHDSIKLVSGCDLSIGRSFDSNLTSLRGSIDMLMERDVFSNTEEDYENLLKQATLENVGHKYNELGLLEEYKVCIGDREVLQTKYIQEEKNGNLTGRIVKEENEYFTNEYEYDALGRITKINDDEIYEYNAYGYLIEDKTYKYTYDTHGNILTKQVKGTGQTIEYKYEDDRFSDLLTSYNGVSITYDTNIGNVKSYGTINYSYEGRRLIRYIKDGYIENYQYDPNGLRIQKKVTNQNIGTNWTTKYVYDNDQLLYEETNGKITRFVYDDNGMLYGFVYNSTRYYYLRDLQQRIIGIVNEEGKYVAGYTYDSYGNHEIESDSDEGFLIALVNPFRYKGYYYDEGTSMYYCKSRYYVPEWGRWLTIDAIEYLDPNRINGLNLFCYCNNDPINYIDPNGNLSWSSYFKNFITNASILLIAVGIGLCATGIGGVAGGVLIGIGAGALIGGYSNEAAGGSFIGGSLGGAVSGGLCALGAGLGGLAFSAASEAVNLTCIGLLAAGVMESFIGGFLGNLAGTAYTSWHDSGFKSVNINSNETLAMSVLMGSLNIFAAIGSATATIASEMAKTAIDLNSQVALRILAGIIAGGTEAAFDLISFLLGKIISIF